MVNFTNEIINQIKEATDDSYIIIIIENSLQKLDVKNINGISAKRMFMMNMVMALQYVKVEGLHPKALENVRNAIEVIERLRKQEYGNLF